MHAKQKKKETLYEPHQYRYLKLHHHHRRRLHYP